MIGQTELFELLVRCDAVPSADGEPADDVPTVLDSFSLTWLAQLLHERHGIVVDPGSVDPGELTSVRAVHDMVASVDSPGGSR